MQRAIWIPGWYELDPPLEVGLNDKFAFWRNVPDHLVGSEGLVFYNTIWHPGDGLFADGKITAIRHSQLGGIRKIDTRGLVYTITLMDDTELLVNAEEDPGKIYERKNGEWVESNRVVSEWRVEVEFDSLSELSAESNRRRTRR